VEKRVEKRVKITLFYGYFGVAVAVAVLSGVAGLKRFVM